MPAAIERRKNQIMELRKMALEDRAARKAAKRAQKTGLFEVDAEQETDDEVLHPAMPAMPATPATPATQRQPRQPRQPAAEYRAPAVSQH